MRRTSSALNPFGERGHQATPLSFDRWSSAWARSRRNASPLTPGILLEGFRSANCWPVATPSRFKALACLEVNPAHAVNKSSRSTSNCDASEALRGTTPSRDEMRRLSCDHEDGVAATRSHEDAIDATTSSSRSTSTPSPHQRPWASFGASPLGRGAFRTTQGSAHSSKRSAKLKKRPRKRRQ